MIGSIPTIQGKTIDSLNELNFAMALEKLEIEYIYKYNIRAMALRGGMQVDFVILPFYWPAEIQVEYWHPENDPDWVLKKAAEFQEFGREPVEFTFEQTETVEAAEEAIKESSLYY